MCSPNRYNPTPNPTPISLFMDRNVFGYVLMDLNPGSRFRNIHHHLGTKFSPSSAPTDKSSLTYKHTPFQVNINPAFCSK